MCSHAMVGMSGQKGTAGVSPPLQHMRLGVRLLSGGKEIYSLNHLTGPQQLKVNSIPSREIIQLCDNLHVIKFCLKFKK